MDKNLKIIFTSFVLFLLIATQPVYSEIAEIKVDASDYQGNISPFLFGSNIQWTWNGDSLWNPQSNDFVSEIKTLIPDLNISVISNIVF